LRAARVWSVMNCDVQNDSQSKRLNFACISREEEDYLTIRHIGGWLRMGCSKEGGMEELREVRKSRENKLGKLLRINSCPLIPFPLCAHSCEHRI